jgi:predicted metal-dependent phosphoesterase TrpH
MKEYLFDPHIHTSEVSACGKLPAKEVVRLYKKAGFSGIVITDHFTSALRRRLPEKSWADLIDSYLSGYELARREGDRIGLAVLWGIEMTFDGGPKGDFLVYGPDRKFLKENPELYRMDLRAFRQLIDGEEINGQEIIVCQAHPFRVGQELAQPHLIDGIEVYNGNPRHFSDNAMARAYAESHGLLRIAGSDAHQREDVARCGLILSKMIHTNKDFVRFLKQNNNIRLYHDGLK